METKELDIIFRGDIVMGHRLQDVKQRLQQLFKVDAAKVDALFTGRPVPLKRGLDEATANKYREILFKAGALVEVSQAAAGPRLIEAKTGSAAEPRAVAPTKSTGWSLAPVGAYLLAPTERPKVNAVLIDTDAISLRPAGENLLDASEQSATPQAAVVVPDFGVAEAGADLVRPDEKLELPLVEIEIEEWGLAEIGTDLIAAEERAAVESAAVLIGDYDLAPVGSDLGQIKPQVTPVTPDISKIRLAD